MWIPFIAGFHSLPHPGQYESRKMFNLCLCLLFRASPSLRPLYPHCMASIQTHTHTHNLNCHWLPLNPELAPLLRISSLGETSMEQGNCLFLWVCYQGSRHSHALRNTDLCSPHSPAAPETRNSKRTVIICIWPERRQ